MFRKSLFIFSILFLLISFSCTSEKEKIAEKVANKTAKIDSTILDFQQKLLKEKIDSVFSENNFNASVLVINNDTILYEKANGFENFKEKTALKTNSIFAIASISKQFTAVLVLLLEDQEKINTEDKVSKYLEEFQTKKFQNITIKELLNHTSGISDFGNGLLSKPGAEFHYSNKGYLYLGKIIEKVSGKSYDENATELFRKIGMKSTFTANSPFDKNFAAAYVGDSKNFQKVKNMPKRLANPNISIPAGGILSTTADLNLWNQALYNGKILKAEIYHKFKEKSAIRNHPIFGEMEYGFGIMMDVKPPLAYFHSGYVRGSPSLNIYYPETKTSVIILSNIANISKGKKAFFNPHKKIKTITDSIQNEVIELRKTLETKGK